MRDKIHGRRYIGMVRMPTSRNTFSKPPNLQTKPFIAGYTPGPLLSLLACLK